ncbi:MAG: hypothetical protein HYZ28_13275 [Myxococcales bacterium]|nr:hypothetical protein [Myxococcales bacterium]
MGPRGGEVCHSERSICISIPHGALERLVTVSIAPAEVQLPGAFGEAFEIGPSDTAFGLPATVTMRYDVYDAGTSPPLLRVYTAENGEWVPLVNPTLNRVAHTVGGDVFHLSPFVLRRLDYGADAGTPDAGPKPDSGTKDAGVDAGRPDAGTPDAGRPDSGTPDAGRPDAGLNDGGSPDAGKPDAGAPDAGTPDAGASDGGAADAGTPDAGQDAGAPDAGPDAGALDAGVDAGTADAGFDAGEVDAGSQDAGDADAGVDAG